MLQNFPKCSQDAPKILPKCSQNDAKMEPNCSPNRVLEQIQISRINSPLLAPKGPPKDTKMTPTNHKKTINKNTENTSKQTTENHQKQLPKGHQKGPFGRYVGTKTFPEPQKRIFT
jgi:hypothetical protein